MENRLASLVAIVAEHLYSLVEELLGQGRVANLLVQVEPSSAHVADRRIAERACVTPMRRVVLQALAVYCVPTAQHLRCLQRVKEILVADRTVALHRIRHADVVIAQLDAVACATGVAVKEVFATAHTADSTLIAVELLL